MGKALKSRASKLAYHSQNQLKLPGFETPFEQNLNPNNRWVITNYIYTLIYLFKNMRLSLCIVLLWILSSFVQMGKAAAQEALYAREVCTSKFNFGNPTKLDEDKIGRIWVCQMVN